MEISETRVKLINNRNDRLRAFSSVTFSNQFVIRDIKIIDGPNGLFVAMPSRKLTQRCEHCKSKNHLKANFCNNCGKHIEDQKQDEASQKAIEKLHADIAHPINAETRKYIQRTVVDAFHKEIEASKQSDYKPKYLDTED